MRDALPALAAIIGPTGAGKSSLAIRMAESLDGEIVNCDSLQIYRGFDLGTAKTPEPERRGIPHHLIDVVNPDECFTAGDYGRLARATVSEIACRGRLPIVVGGTGFYLRALLDGLPPLPERDETLRRRLARREERRPGSLHRLLSRLDRSAAERIHARDVRKVMRALEVRMLTGVPSSGQLPAEPLSGFRVFKLGLFPPREALNQRLDRRTEQMFTHGLIEEVRALRARGVPEHARAFGSLGYRQALAAVRGEMSLDAAITDTKLATRQYAKRQMTWFRHEPGIRIISSFGEDVHDWQWLKSN